MCLLLLAVLPVLCAQERCPLTRVPDELRTKFNSYSVCEPVPAVSLLKHLWAPIKVKVTCGSSRVSPRVRSCVAVRAGAVVGRSKPLTWVREPDRDSRTALCA